MSRTKKQAYTKSKRFDRSCRNHGGCPHCEGNRLHQAHKAEVGANIEEQLAEHEIEPPWRYCGHPECEWCRGMGVIPPELL